jgi:hypothetical protein
MLCVYFVVKGFEILSNPAQRGPIGQMGAILAFVAAPIFFWLSIEQVGQMNRSPLGANPSSFDPATAEELNESTEDAVKNADEALRRADEAIANVQRTLER